jgi:hypothetical protein
VVALNARYVSQCELERFSYALLEPIFAVWLAIGLRGPTLSSIDRDEPEPECQLTLA